jgi:DNA invertase Pin-like site-specific DNA recombinase
MYPNGHEIDLMSRKLAFIYARVSRGWTHRRGPLIEDQQRACRDYAERCGYAVAEEFIEIEYGKGRDSLEQRPVLRRCLERAVAEAMPIIVLDINRITRNVNFLAQLLKSRVMFLVAGGQGEPGTVLGPRRAVSRQTKVLIGQRMREVLRVRRENGLPLGNAASLSRASSLGRRVIADQADRFARQVAPIIDEIFSSGVKSLSAVADALNSKGVRAPRRGRWTSTTVKRVLSRAERANTIGVESN